MKLSEFKVGDRIICHCGNEGEIIRKGVAKFKNISRDVILNQDGLYVRCENDPNHTIVKHLPSTSLTFLTMTLLEKASLAFKSEPEKSFRKAGITNGDDVLTDEGVKVFLGWLLRKQGTEFKTEVVDTILKEMKEEK